MAEKMFADQLRQRGLADAVRVSSAGTGNWHVGKCADERAAGVLRAHGYPPTPRRTGRRRAPGGRSGGGPGPQPRSDAAAPGRPMRTAIRMLRSFDPRSGAHAPDVDDPYYGDTRRLRDAFTPSSRPRCRACTTGSTSGSAQNGTRLMRRLAVSAAPGLDRAGPGGRRLRVSVLYGARAVAAGQEHQDVAGEPPDRIFAEHRAGSVENAAAAAGFVGIRRAVAPGHRNRSLPAGRAGAGPVAGDRREAGIRGAGAVRRRRWTDRPGRPRLRAAPGGVSCPADPPPARADGDHHGAAAQLRGVPR